MYTMYLKKLIREILERNSLRSDNDFLFHVANVESNGGMNLTQIGGGPGRGYYQYEMWVVKDLIKRLRLPMPPPDVLLAKMTYDLEYQTIIARRHLYTWREAIPTDLLGQARYWKKYWNTKYGKGTVEHFMIKNKGK